jgi:hypothetical protein
MCYEVDNVLGALKSRVNRKVKVFYSFHVIRIQTADIFIGCGMKVDKETYTLIVGCLYSLGNRIHAQLRYVHF